jgi:voltage-gated sodium channel
MMTSLKAQVKKKPGTPVEAAQRGQDAAFYNEPRKTKFLDKLSSSLGRKPKGEGISISVPEDDVGGNVAGGPSMTTSGDGSSGRRKTAAPDRGYVARRSTKTKKQESSSYHRGQRRRGAHTQQDDITLQEQALTNQTREVEGRNEESKKPWVDRTPFSAFMGIMIFLNSILVALETDHEEDLGQWDDIANQFFVMLYVAEFVARVYFHGAEYFYDPFNCFDTLLVIIAFMDEYFMSNNRMSAFSSLKLIRMLRLVRLVRLVRFFKELYLVVVGLASTMKTLFWVSLLLGAILWTNSILLAMILGKSQAWMFVDRASALPFEYFNVDVYFGSVLKSCFTLFQMVTLDEWASKILRPVCNVYPMMAMFFFAFVFMSSYGLMNIVVGVIVRDALVQGRQNKAREKKLKTIREQKAAIQLRKFFKIIDTDGSGTIDLEELMSAVANPRAREYFNEIDIDTRGAVKIFKCLDIDGDQNLTCDEFVDGVMSAKSKAEDMVRLSLEMSALIARSVYLEDRLLAVSKELLYIKTSMSDAYNAIYRQHRMRFEDPKPSRDYWILKKDLESVVPPRPQTPPKVRSVTLEQEVAVARWQQGFAKPESTAIHAWDAAPTLGELLVAPNNTKKQRRTLRNSPQKGVGLPVPVLDEGPPAIPPPPQSLPEAVDEPEPEEGPLYRPNSRSVTFEPHSERTGVTDLLLHSELGPR